MEPGVDGQESAVSEGQAAIIEGTPEAYGVLDLLNDPTTTFERLDIDVRLDRRAAENLIAHRDAEPANPFDDIAEVDAVAYVGPSALDKLLAYAEAQGYVATGDDLLGVFDNVAFTVNEAEATLALVNSASFEELDEQVELDVRAVESIVAARAIGSLVELASLYYVGQSAMLKLRDYAALPSGDVAYGDPCNAHSECQSGLCAGLTVPNAEHGWCMLAWMAGTFENQSDVAISDDGAAAESVIVVTGLASVPMDVIVDVDIDHPRKQDLEVRLYQPNGPVSLLWNHEANPPTHFVWPPGLEGDNMVNGHWILEVRDTVTGSTGTVRGWSMWLSSRYD